MSTVSPTKFAVITSGLPSVGDLVSSIDQFACGFSRRFWGLGGEPNKPSKHRSLSLSSVIALHDFTSAGISWGDIAIAASELRATRTPIVTKAWIFALGKASKNANDSLVSAKHARSFRQKTQSIFVHPRP